MRRWLRTLRLSWWLGWQIESNWTDPLRFFVFAIARPLGGALILFFMYRVVAGATGGALIGFFVTGAAFWPFVLGGVAGMALSIIGDREHYRTLKYVYTAPIPWPAYLVGRSLAMQTSAVAAATITLTFGTLVLGARISPATLRPAVLVPSLVLGIGAVTAVGLLVVAVAVSVSGEAWRMPEAVGASLYLISGVVFPVSVLPGALQAVAKAVPLTWWLEGIRRGVLGPTGVRSFTGLSDAHVLATLAWTTAAWLAGAWWVFSFAERRARRLGILDRESAF